MTSVSALDAVLAAADLDQLAAAVAAVGEPDAAVLAGVQEVLDLWDDEQAVSNLLLQPALLPPATRVPSLIRGLEDTGYVQVAAAVGSSRVPAPIGEEDRVALVDALLDLMAGQAGLAAQRASVAVAGLVHRSDAAELVVLLGHPDDVVRRNLQAAAIQLLGGAGLDALLDDRGQVHADDAELARAELAQDGVDLTVDAVPELAEPAFLPSYRDFAESDRAESDRAEDDRAEDDHAENG